MQESSGAKSTGPDAQAILWEFFFSEASPEQHGRPQVVGANSAGVVLSQPTGGQPLTVACQKQ